MTEVFFYHGAADRLAAACALMTGAAAQRKPLLVFAPGPLAEQVDRRLWTHQPLSFVPHCRADSPLAAETPLLITESLDGDLPPVDRLMNLSNDIPGNFGRFARLVEVVGQEEEDRSAARMRVRQYKDAGCDVHYFDLSDR